MAAASVGVLPVPDVLRALFSPQAARRARAGWGVAMSRWNRVLRSPVLDAVAVLFAVVQVTLIAQMLPLRMFSYDFNNYYVSSRLLLEGQNPYRTPLAARAKVYGFEHSEMIAVATNPPLLLWLFAPLTILSPRTAFWVWVAVETASLAIILWLTKRLLKDRLTPRGWRFVYAGSLASAPVLWHFAYGPIELLIAAVLLAAHKWNKDGKYIGACVAVLLAGMMKIYPLMLLPWFIWRR